MIVNNTRNGYGGVQCTCAIDTYSIDECSKFDELLFESTDRPQTTHVELAVHYPDELI